MLCKYPTTVGSHVYPCGRCDPCRINRKRVWTNRLLLEASCHGDNSYWTLTYNDQHLPRLENGLSTLKPLDAQLFMKRIRKAWDHFQDTAGIPSTEKRLLRFFLVGEYGEDINERPHYHLALFGFPRCANGTTLRLRNRSIADRCCLFCRCISTAWGKGDIDGGGLEEGSARYVCGYVLKKLTKPDDFRLMGRHPEFGRMSNRPGIGFAAMKPVAKTLIELGLDESETDVPSALRRGSTIAPLGRYLRQSLRQFVGKPKEAPQAAHDENFARMLPLRLAARSSSENPSLAGQIVEAYRQDVHNAEKRALIFKKRGSL